MISLEKSVSTELDNFWWTKYLSSDHAEKPHICDWSRNDSWRYRISSENGGWNTSRFLPFSPLSHFSPSSLTLPFSRLPRRLRDLNDSLRSGRNSRCLSRRRVRKKAKRSQSLSLQLLYLKLSNKPISLLILQIAWRAWPSICVRWCHSCSQLYLSSPNKVLVRLC